MIGEVWTDDKIQQLDEMLRKGVSVKDAANFLGTTQGNIYNICSRKKIKCPRSMPPDWSEEELRCILDAKSPGQALLEYEKRFPDSERSATVVARMVTYDRKRAEENLMRLVRDERLLKKKIPVVGDSEEVLIKIYNQLVILTELQKEVLGLFRRAAQEIEKRPSSSPPSAHRPGAIVLRGMAGSKVTLVLLHVGVANCQSLRCTTVLKQQYRRRDYD